MSDVPVVTRKPRTPTPASIAASLAFDEVRHAYGDVESVRGVSLGADEPRTIRLEPTPDGGQPTLGGLGQLLRGTRFTSNIRIAGTNGFAFIGGNSQILSACDDLSGTVLFNGSTIYFSLASGGSMPNVSEIALWVLEQLTFNPGSAGQIDRLGDSCVIRGATRTGRFLYNGQRSDTTPSTAPTSAVVHTS